MNPTRRTYLHFSCFATAIAWRLFLLSSVLAFLANVPVSLAFAPSTAFGTRATSSPHDTWLHMAQRRGRPRGPLRTFEEKPTMNEEISFDELRVVTPNPKGKDEPLGIMSKQEALEKAQELGGLDLILINENSSPPVCKIVDYSKWRYMKEKKAKELKKNAKATEIKEVKMSYKIDVHDYDVRKKSASKFLNQGNRVKCTVMFRGREVQHDQLGFELLDKLTTDLGQICQKEGNPKREGRNLSLILTPKPEVLKRINEEKRAEERAKKKKKEESLRSKQETHAGAAATAAGGVAVAAAVAQEEAEQFEALDDDEALLNAVSLEQALQDDDSQEMSLDDLLGKDDLTDELFG